MSPRPGPRLEAEVVPGGGDWMVRRGDVCIRFYSVD